MKPLLLLNPSSQAGKTGAEAPELERIITRYVGPVDRVHTERPRHAVDLAEEAAREGRDTVIVVGGDGTIHEAANGLMRAREAGISLPRLGIIGRGTGGDFRKTLGIEHRLDRYCQAIASKKTRKVDIGRFTFCNKAGQRDQAWFINILSMGMGGLVDEYVAEDSGKLGGTFAYFSASFRALLRSEVGILDCVLRSGDQRQSIEITTRQIAICNGRFFGSGMEVAPMAKPDDGIFNVVSLGAASRFKFAVSSLSIYSGSHINSPEVEVLECDGIDIELRNDSIRDIYPLDVDGEPLGTLPVSIDLVPQAIEVFVGDDAI